MKKSILLSSLLAITLTLSVGCTKSQDHKDELNKTLAEINQKNQNTLDNLNKLSNDIANINTEGGQPGKITLNGEIARAANKTDARLSLSLSAGLTRAGSETVLVKKDLVTTNNLTADKIEELKATFKNSEDKERTYINLGCELSESETAGLTESTQKIDDQAQIIQLSATRIFMCGKVNYDKLSYIISASEIMLKDLNITYTKNIGSLKISAGTLVLLGENKITSKGEDSSLTALPGASLDLTVIGEIAGDGTLSLEVKGANNIAEKN